MKTFDYPRLGETVLRTKLPNGLNIIVVPRPGFTKTLAYFATDFGSVHRDFTLDGKPMQVPAGIAHFLEHKMFDMPGGRDVSAEFAALGAGTNAFTSCDALEELILADGLTTLGYSAFNHLDSLKTVNIPGSIKTIPKMAFYFSDIETLNIAEGVEAIGDDAFAYCKKLKEVHIPATLTTIGGSAFRDCESITDVYFYGTETQWNNIDIGLSNECLVGEAWGGFWFGPTIHFADAPPCSHKNTTVKPAVEPTCTETGLTEGKICADCGELLTEQKLIPTRSMVAKPIFWRMVPRRVMSRALFTLRPSCTTQFWICGKNSI